LWTTSSEKGIKNQSFKARKHIQIPQSQHILWTIPESEKPMQRLETMSNTPFNQCRILVAKSFQDVMQKSFTRVSKSNMKFVRPVASFVLKA
jgi:hypothetical protein